MITTNNKIEYWKLSIHLTCVIILLIISNMSVFAQVTVTPSTQTFNFGTFTVYGTTGGTVVISTAGVRSATGNVVLMGGTVSALAFTITSGNGKPPGKGSTWDFTITYPNSVTLSRTGGVSMTLNPGPISPSAIFSIGNNTTRLVYIGGKLNVGSITANPAGSYSGTFNVTFNYN